MQERVKQRKGFTIVELLIVIVVIAILAAITVVAYTGIQNRAQNTQTVSATTTYLKAMMQYKAENGIYPDTYNSGYHITCLGGVENATNCDGNDSLTRYNMLHTALEPYMSSRPNPSYAGRINGNWSGTIYTYSSGFGGYYFLMSQYGTTDCPDMSGMSLYSKSVYGADVGCRYILPDQ